MTGLCVIVTCNSNEYVVTEWILNGTSAQLGCTLPFTLVHAEKYRIKNTHNTQTKHNPKKANNAKHCKTKLHWYADYTSLLQNSVRQRGGFILQCCQAHMGQRVCQQYTDQGLTTSE